MPAHPLSSPSLLRFPYSAPLLGGKLIRRYNRFLADIRLDSGPEVVAHCVNTGRMEGLVEPGARVWLSPADNPNRKLKYTWELVEIDGQLIGANTSVPNYIVRELLQERLLTGLGKWDEMRPEYKINPQSRVDFWLREGKREHFIEVKNCHLVYPDNRGYFPDSVSARASKHLEELIELVEAGHRATVVFTAQSASAKALRPSDLHDPVFAETARRAASAGVKFRALRVIPTVEALIVEKAIPVDLKPYSMKKPQSWKDANNHRSGWIQVRKAK